MKNKYIIRIDALNLCDKITYINGVGTCKSISNDELINDLQTNGLEIIQFKKSVFGACYFFEVTGVYSGNIKIIELDTNSDNFCWDV